MPGDAATISNGAGMKILLVEDSYVERRKIGGYLTEWGLDYVMLGNGTEAIQLVDAPNPPDLALLDWLLPGQDGIDVLRHIRRLTQGNYIYTIMLTAKNRKNDLLTAMAAGADDYLSKPVDPAELRSRIMVGKRILELQQSLRFAATHDFLTNLLNRAEIIAALEREFSRSGREEKPATVILVDIDHFKRVNDTMGHAAGDEVLKQVAIRLKADLRPYDLVGRYGGEEFIIILPACSLEVGARRANEIRELVAKEPLKTPSGTTFATVSMGVTAMPATHGGSVAELLHEADMSLYAAKSNGRNRIEIFSSLAKSSGASQD